MDVIGPIGANQFFSIDARLGLPAGEPFIESGAEEIATAAARARAVFAGFAAFPDAARAELLKALAMALDSQRGTLVDIADRETALGPGRLNGEVDRTTFQLRAIADYVATGQHRRTQHDAALPGPPPAGRPSLIRTFVPVGPVAVFAPSNFPFAFSVLGGDTASALAAGNPVIVKAHPAHPDLSRATWLMARSVLRGSGVSDDVLQMVQGPSPAVGLSLVGAPEIAAVGFTGSSLAGRALQERINQRAVPIPFYGELSSVNPVVALPEALQHDAGDLATRLAASITLSSGQFCTSPGVLLLLEHPVSRTFIASVVTALQQSPTHPMLTMSIRQHYERRLAELLAVANVSLRTGGPSAGASPAPTLIEVVPEEFLRTDSLRQEVFGPCCVAVVARDASQVIELLDAVGGSLTVTVWSAPRERASAARIGGHAMLIAGRVLFAGVPTGVAVTATQQHGGPWPSSSRPDTTSVGPAAIERFMRPVALQDLRADLGLIPA